MSIHQAPLGELVARPFVRLFHVGGTCQARANIVGEMAHKVHHLTVVEFLLPQAGDELEVGNFRPGYGRCGAGRGGCFLRFLVRLLASMKISREERNGNKGRCDGHQAEVSESHEIGVPPDKDFPPQRVCKSRTGRKREVVPRSAAGNGGWGNPGYGWVSCSMLTLRSSSAARSGSTEL